tara:strand:- start:84 stop:215 length:132 start_codon:yes stop_codon:yes gene_type:complete
MVPIAYVTYDRKGETWRSFEMGFCQQKQGIKANHYINGNPEWS